MKCRNYHLNIRKKIIFHCEDDHTLEQVSRVVMEPAPLQTLETLLHIGPRQPVSADPGWRKVWLSHMMFTGPFQSQQFCGNSLSYLILQSIFFKECEGVMTSLKTSQSHCLCNKRNFQSNYLQSILAYRHKQVFRCLLFPGQRVGYLRNKTEKKPTLTNLS